MPAMRQLPASSGCVHMPLAQMSAVHARLSDVQAAPSGLVVYAVVLIEGWHASQSLSGSCAPAITHEPAMRQKFGNTVWAHAPAMHAEVVQAGPLPAHIVPSTRLDQALVLAAGWHDWQGLSGFVAPAATQLPEM